MLFKETVRSARRQLVATSRNRRQKNRRGQERLGVETLEIRRMLSTIWVYNTDDSGDGSLRDAVEEANANPGKDKIKFHRSAWGTIALSSQLLITDDLVIDGPEAQKLSVSGQGAERIFLVLPAELADDPFVTPSSAQLETAPEVTIRRLTVENGHATDAPGNPSPGPFAFGGGIYNLGGTVHLEKVEMTGNSAEGILAAAGAVANEFGGTLTVSHSHFAQNTANGTLVGVGGAISSDLGSTVESFSVEGSGLAPDGFPLSGEDPRPHFIDVGTLTVGDTTLSYNGEGTVQTFSEDLSTGTGTFGSADPFIFTDEDGDTLVTFYGRTDKGAEEEGTFTLLPASLHPDGLAYDSGDVFAHWIAEFVVQPESTGKYAGASGSWIMDAYSEPFSPADIGPTGVNTPLEYRWESREFTVEGSGDAPDGFPLSADPIPRAHFIDAGTLTVGGTTRTHTGAGTVQTFSEDFTTLTGTFGSADPFVFTDEDGDTMVTFYGRTDKGAEEEGRFVLLPADLHPDDLPFDPGDVFAHWIAEFTVQPESTGKYARYGSNGSWIMDAYSEPFSPAAIDPTSGVNIPLEYRWESRGVQLVFPSDHPEVEIHHSSFEYNTASAVLGHIPTEAFSGLAAGGAILNVTGIMSIDRSTFTANSVRGGDGIGDAVKGGPGFGGAINSSNISPFGAAQSVLKVRNSTFVYNVATGGDGQTGPEGGEASGGAIKVTNGGEAQLDSNKFKGNRAIGGKGIGGANGGAATGGAVAGSAGATLSLNRNSFSGNSVDGGASDDGAGGVGRGGAFGLFSVDLTGWIPDLSGAASVYQSDFTDNTATGGMGGGIYNEGEVSVSKSSFTGNEAIGAADVVLEISAAAKAAGGAFGGGIANFGTLKVSSASFESNLSQGADDVDVSSTAWPDVAFPGGAWAGGLGNAAVATVDRSRFVGNVAEAGHRGQGSFATLSVGGAIYNDASLTLSRSDLRHNESRGGDEGISPFHNGHALGGALASGTLLPALGVPVTAELVVSHTGFHANSALGGSENQVTLPSDEVPPADGPNNAYGGAILVYQGSVELDGVKIVKNEAIAGAGGADKNGSLGVGGGVFLFDFLGGVSSELHHVLLVDNRAVGGDGTAGSPDGGAGIGGGIAVGSLGSPFAGQGSATISDVIFYGNEAQGGAGFGGGSGGAGQGGGLANVFNGATTVRKSLFIRNQATGGQGGINGNGGDGQGGGVYNADGASLDLVLNLIFGNLAEGGNGGVGGGLDGAGYGGGVFNEGALDIALTSIFGNEADFGDDIWP